MFIAHLPAGYVAARLLLPRLEGVAGGRRALLLASLAGAMAPDLDLLWFFLVDERRHPHHAYLSHWPVLWLVLLLFAWAWTRRAGGSPLPWLTLAFAVNGLLHLVLDSVAGGVHWLAPWSGRGFSMLTVEARFQPWWLNFLLHPSFVLELAIVAWAIGSHRRPWMPMAH